MTNAIYQIIENLDWFDATTSCGLNNQTCVGRVPEREEERTRS